MENEDTFDCADCGESTPDAEAREDNVGNNICDECYSSNYSTCEDCDDVVPDDEIISVDNGSKWICDGCRDNNYFTCGDCEEVKGSDESYYTLHDESVCHHCLDYNYSHCDDCDGYYHHDFSYDHEHGGCDCAPPTNLVALRNGDDTLRQNERTIVSLAAGVVSDEGLGAISRLIRAQAPSVPYDLYATDPAQYAALSAEASKWHNLSYELENVGSEWQSKDGNFTKRLSRYAYKTYGIKVPSSVVSEIGNLGAQHSQGSDHAVEITRDLNLPAEDFAHSDSCWWQSYAASRCTLKNNGGFGLRAFNDDSSWNPVVGRAWVMPLRLVNGGFEPTFDATGADAFMVFNGYGTMSGYTPARIVAQMTGMTYRKVGFTGGEMYVNSDAGYLVAPETIAADFTDGNVNLYLDEHARLFWTESKELAHV